MDARETVSRLMLSGGGLILVIGVIRLIGAQAEQRRQLSGWTIAALGTAIAVWGACL